MSDLTATANVIINNFETGDTLRSYATKNPMFWIFCYGQTLSQDDYPDLFATIGHLEARKSAFDSEGNVLHQGDFDKDGNNLLEAQGLFRLPQTPPTSQSHSSYWTEVAGNKTISIENPITDSLIARATENETLPTGQYIISDISDNDYLFLNGQEVTKTENGLIEIFHLLLVDGNVKPEKLGLSAKITAKELTETIELSHEITEITVPESLDKVIIAGYNLEIDKEYTFGELLNTAINQFQGHTFTAISETELIPSDSAYIDTSGVFTPGDGETFALIEYIEQPLQTDITLDINEAKNFPLINVSIEGENNPIIIKSGLTGTILEFIQDIPITQMDARFLVQNGITSPLNQSHNIIFDRFAPVQGEPFYKNKLFIHK